VGIWRDECGRVADESSFSARRTGSRVQETVCEATTALGSHGVIATWWTWFESRVSPFTSFWSASVTLSRSSKHTKGLEAWKQVVEEILGQHTNLTLHALVK
jgi:hypothetical protein